MKNMLRKHITFYGWVQGVGFRYRARHAAELYGCTGWVRNEWDGSVTMEIQGTEEAIDNVILAIKRRTYIRIENMDCWMIPVDPEERGFKTR
jgi:acylphosphatase